MQVPCHAHAPQQREQRSRFLHCALDWLSLLLCCFIYVAVWHESSGPLSRRATAPRIRAVLSAVGCRLAPLAPRKVRTVDERGEG